jgi:hypothetical protein
MCDPPMVAAPSIGFRLPSLSGIFIAVWLIPFAMIFIGVVHFRYVSYALIPLMLLPALAGWIGMRIAGPARRVPQTREWSTKSLQRGFYLLSAVAVTGHYLLRTSYSQAGLDVGGGGIQELYLAVVEAQTEGSLSTGPLGTLGQLLRTAQPFALICGVFLFYRQRGVLQRLLIAAILAGSTYMAYLSSFSRGSMMFYMACVLFAALSMPYSRRKLFVYSGALVVTGSLFFLASAQDRMEVIGIDEARQTEALLGLFDCDLTPISATILNVGGPGLLGLTLYLTSPIVEGAHVVTANASPLMMGGFTFFPVVNPVKRLLGINTDLDMSTLDRINTWDTVVGEMYLDFALYGFLVFPLVAFLMYRLATRFAGTGLWGQNLAVITAVFFTLFPLYSVFHSFGLVYAVALALAINARPVMRRSPPQPALSVQG